MNHRILRKGQAPTIGHTELYDRITKIEDQVLFRIQELKNLPKSVVCQHLIQPFQGEVEPYNEKVNYYDLYWKQFLLNQLGLGQVKELGKDMMSFKRKLNKIEKLFEKRETELKPLERRRGREKHQKDDLNFACQTCQKRFVDQQTLLLHLRIKHRGDQKKKGSLLFESGSSN